MLGCCQFLVVLVLSSFSSVHGGSYFNDAFGTESFNVPFGEGHLNVWEHTRTKGRYYVSPITGLLTDTAVCQNNVLANTIELRFKLLMWSLEAREGVYQHIKTNLNSSVSIDDIEPLPMERIRLVWRDADRPLDDAYRLSQTWRTNTRLPSVVEFLILCKDMNACEKFKRVMKENPGILDGLELQYVVEAQRSSRKTVNIQGRHVMKSRLFTQLKNQVNPSSAPVYLKSEDLKRIVSETVSNVVASIITDADFEMEDDFSIKDAVAGILTQQRLSASDFTPQMWNSTFWDPVMSRPDKVTKEVNSVYSKDSMNSSYLTVNDETLHKKHSFGGRVNYVIFSTGVSGQGSTSHVKKARTEDVINMLKERNTNVEWNGERFVVKPIDLYRLNIGELNTTSTIAIGNVQIRKYEVIHHIRVNVNPSENQTASIARLRYNLKGIIEDHTKTLLHGIFNNSPIDISLVNGTKNSTLHSGRVQIMYFGEQGTICDDSWSLYDAKVVCKMLGYKGRSEAVSKAAFGPGTGKIWLDEVKCGSDDVHLSQCGHNPWGVNDCSHSEDAGVVCYIN